MRIPFKVLMSRAQERLKLVTNNTLLIPVYTSERFLSSFVCFPLFDCGFLSLSKYVGLQEREGNGLLRDGVRWPGLDCGCVVEYVIIGYTCMHT